MFVRVGRTRFPPEHAATGLRIVLGSLVPALRRAPGYRGAIVLVSAKPDAVISVDPWDSEEEADAASLGADVAATHVRLAALGFAIETRQMYEVALDDRIGSSRDPPRRPGETRR